MTENTLATIRRAYRYVVAYERRMLDATAALGTALEDAGWLFRGWYPLHRAMPSKSRFSPDHWAWDGLPMFACRHVWTLAAHGEDDNGVGNAWVLLEHVADTSWESNKRGSREPDPLENFDPNKGLSVLRARWIQLHATVRPELWRLAWEQIVERVFPSPNDAWPMTPSSVRSTSNESMTVGGVVVALDGIERAEQLRERLIEPTLAAVASFSKSV